MKTLGDYKRRRKRNGPKLFRGWAHIHSKTGSDWGLWDNWLLVGLYAGKRKAVSAMSEYKHTDCCPCNVVPVYY